jgi:hypothetical protein
LVRPVQKALGDLLDFEKLLGSRFEGGRRLLFERAEVQDRKTLGWQKQGLDEDPEDLYRVESRVVDQAVGEEIAAVSSLAGKRVIADSAGSTAEIG